MDGMSAIIITLGMLVVYFLGVKIYLKLWNECHRSG